MLRAIAAVCFALVAILVSTPQAFAEGPTYCYECTGPTEPGSGDCNECWHPVAEGHKSCIPYCNGTCSVGVQCGNVALQNLLLSPDGTFRSVLADNVELAIEVEMSTVGAPLVEAPETGHSNNYIARNCLGFITARVLAPADAEALRAELSTVVI